MMERERRECWWRLAGIVALAAVATLGCRRAEVVHRFPSAWPSSITLTERAPKVVSPMPSARAAVIAVEPVRWLSLDEEATPRAPVRWLLLDEEATPRAPARWPEASPEGSSVGEEAAAGADSSTTVIQRLMAERLRAMGLTAWPSDREEASSPAYRLACTIEAMECTVSQGYPSVTRTLTAIRCQLLRPDGKVAWERHFTEPLEQVHLVNTMSRRPVDYQAMMVRDGLLPALEVVLAGVRRYVEQPGLHGMVHRRSGSTSADAATQPEAL